MPKVHKSFRDYLSKFKPQYPHAYLPSTASLSSSKKWICRNCKHPRTFSFAIDNKNGLNGDNDKPTDDESATLSDIDRFLFENFKSLYLRDDEDDPNHKRVDDEKQETPKQGPILFDTPQDLSGSSKFFVAPGLRSSFTEEAGTSVITTSDDQASSSSTSISSNTPINDSILNYQKKEKEHVSQTPIPEDCIPIFTYSASPCQDFERSMKEMVEARFRDNEGIDWEFMEELLFCYLKHNDKKSYKYILNAFVDIIVVLRQHKLVTFPSETDPDVVVELPSLPPLKNNEIPDFLNPRSKYPFLKMLILDQFKNVSNSFCILMDTFEDLELENIRYMSKLLPIKAVGPLFKSSKPQNKAIRGDQMKADDCIEWLHSQSKSSVVYISFGTVVYIPQEQVEEIAHALMNSNLSFLWVLKPPHKDFSFLKKHILPEGFSEKTAGRGKVVQFSPQEEVLAHPSLACFVTHCGWNSTVETLTSGVPVVTFPAWGDQVTNAKFLVDVYGVGIKLGHSEIEEKIMCREEVKKCLLEATVGTKAEQLREKALKWKVAAEGAVAEGGSSDCNLQCFVEYIKRKSTVALVNGVSNHVDQSA